MSSPRLIPHAAALLATFALASTALAQHGYYRQPCPCPPDGNVPQTAAPGAVAPEGEEPAEPEDDFAMPAAQDVASAPAPVANMIGDFFGNGIFVSPNDGPYGSGSLPIAGGDRRYKVSDNLSPIPTDRVYFNFHQFNNAVTDINDNSRDVTRYTFGVEKTFWCKPRVGRISSAFRRRLELGSNHRWSQQHRDGVRQRRRFAENPPLRLLRHVCIRRHGREPADRRRRPVV